MYGSQQDNTVPRDQRADRLDLADVSDLGLVRKAAAFLQVNDLERNFPFVQKLAQTSANKAGTTNHSYHIVFPFWMKPVRGSAEAMWGTWVKSGADLTRPAQ